MRIEDDVVGATQRRAGGLGVERLDRTAGDIDALDRPAGIIGGGAVRDQQPIRLDPVETTVVAAIELAVGADREAVGAAAGFGHGLITALGTYAGAAAHRVTDHHHAAVGYIHTRLGNTHDRREHPQLAPCITTPQ